MKLPFKGFVPNDKKKPTPGVVRMTKTVNGWKTQSSKFTNKTVHSPFRKVNKDDVAKLFTKEALKTWITQLLENSLERLSKNIKITFYDEALNGFDVVDDG